MYANFTEETCTGGATLALAGATTGNIPFSESFADGDLVAYVLEDSGGTIKVAGIGTYVSATDDITRNDTWNWNGTAIDDNPSTNITLSGGTHTVRCGAMSNDFFFLDRDLSSATSGAVAMYPDNIIANGSTAFTNNNRLFFTPAVFFSPVVITNLIMEVETLATATNVRSGIYTCDAGGKPSTLIEETGDFSSSVGTTGTKVVALTNPVKLSAGTYWFATVTDTSALKFRLPSTVTNIIMSPSGRNSIGSPIPFHQDSVTGALPSTVGTLVEDTLWKTSMGFS